MEPDGTCVEQHRRMFRAGVQGGFAPRPSLIVSSAPETSPGQRVSRQDIVANLPVSTRSKPRCGLRAVRE
jgi:hypothetical protein